MKKFLNIFLLSSCLLIWPVTFCAEAVVISILTPSAEEQVLESGRDFYVIGSIEREGVSPENMPFDIRVYVAETGLVRDGKIITANGTGQLEFCREILYALEADTAEAIEKSYLFYKNVRRSFFVL